MLTKDIKRLDKMPIKQKTVRNTAPQPGRSGGWIARMLLMDGKWIERDRINYPTETDLAVKRVTALRATLLKNEGSEFRATHNIVMRYDARLDFYDAMGKNKLYEITCTKEQSTILI